MTIKKLHFYFARTSGALVQADCLEAIGYGGKYQIYLNKDSDSWFAWFLVPGSSKDDVCLAEATSLLHALAKSGDHYLSQQSV